MQPSKHSNWKSTIVTWGSVLTGAGLILLGMHVFVPEFAAWGYGVEPLDDKGTAYLTATGARDLSLGLMTLYLLKYHRAAIAIFMLCMLVVPVADTLIVLKYGEQVWKILPHAVGIVGISAISYFAFAEQKASNSR